MTNCEGKPVPPAPPMRPVPPTAGKSHAEDKAFQGGRPNSIKTSSSKADSSVVSSPHVAASCLKTAASAPRTAQNVQKPTDCAKTSAPPASSSKQTSAPTVAQPSPPQTAAPNRRSFKPHIGLVSGLVSQWLWIRSVDVVSLGVSLFFHLTLLLMLSFFVVQVQKNGRPFSTVVSEANDQGVDLAGADQTKIALPKPEIKPSVSSLLHAVSIKDKSSNEAVSADALSQTLQSSLDSLVRNLDTAEDGGGQQQGLKDGVGFRMPGSGNVVRKGSFVAWTVPQDPAPYEDYLIIVQVNVPKRIRNYNGRDLTGFMIGTDGYTTRIGFYQGRYYGTFIRKANQLVIRIPGAEKNVRDTIVVESKLLRERQELHIVF